MAHEIDETLTELRAEIESKLVNVPGSDQPVQFAPFDPSPILERRILHLCEVLSDNHYVETDIARAFRPDTAVSRILATLILINCKTDIFRSFRGRFALNNANEIYDSNLPLEQNVAQELFGEQLGNLFYKKQYIFCPMLVGVGDNTCEDLLRPLPFLDPEDLGSGASGDVCKVTIPKDCFNWERGRNTQPETIAWKSIKEKSRFENEKNILDIIKNSRTSHSNISLALGSLVLGKTRGLFFPLAKCDLDSYLRDPKTQIPRKRLDVHKFLLHFRDLIAALKFLHDDLDSNSKENSKGLLRICHLDLKPKNILIFQGPDPSGEIWKIHDFGFSKYGKQHPDDNRSFLPFSIQTKDNSSSGTTIRHMGSFLAPETEIRSDNDMGKVKAASDIWSLGCILCLVISFLDEGPESITKFEEDRKSGAKTISDFFYVQNSKKNLILNPGVRIWFKKLKQRFAVSDQDVKMAISDIIKILQKEILLIKPTNRASSYQMIKLFDRILARLFDPKNCHPHHVDRDMWTLVRDLFRPEEVKAPKQPSKTYRLALAPESRKSKFSPCGSHLAFLAPEVISFFHTSDIFVTDPGQGPYGCSPRRTPRLAHCPGTSKWDDFAVGCKYLVAKTAELYFDCLIYPYPSTNEEVRDPYHPPVFEQMYHFKLYTMRSDSKICSMALSPDSRYIVHILKGPHNEAYIYLSLVDDMIAWHDDQRYPDILHQSSQNPIVLPWRSKRLQVDGNIEAIKHIRDIQFSADSQMFVIFSELPQVNKCMFYAWKTEHGKYTGKVTAKLALEGIDTHQEWITAFVPLTSPESVLIIMFQNFVTQRYWLKSMSKWTSVEMKKMQLLDILPIKNTDDRYLFIGRDNPNAGTVKALYVEKHKLKNNISNIEFQYRIDLECDTWIPGRDAAITLDDGRKFVIARVDGTGFVRSFERANAPIMSSR